MSAIRMGEEAVDAVLAALKAGLAAKLAAIAASKGDSLTPSAPDVNSWFRSRVSAREIVTTPAIFVLSPEGNYDSPSIGGQWEMKRQIFVASALEGTDSEILQIQVDRMNRAVIEVLLESSTTAGGALATAGYYIQENFKDGSSPLGGGDKAPFFQNGAVEVTLQSVEV